MHAKDDNFSTHILLTTPYQLWPVNYGGAVRTTQLAHWIGQLGYRVTLLSAGQAGPDSFLGNNVRWLTYDHQGRIGHFWNRHFRELYRQVIKDDVDLIVAGFPYQSYMLTRPAEQAGIPIVYDAHNVEHDRFRRMSSASKARLVHLTEGHLVRHAKSILTVSKDDQALLLDTYGRQSNVLPNGVNLDQFHPAPRSEALLSKYNLNGKKVLLFFGPLDYWPNIEALKFLLDHVWPEVLKQRNDTHFLIVGRNPPEWAHNHPAVTVTGEVDNIVEHIRLADLVVTPIDSGGGTRLKIIEALACGQRVLSTPFAAMGIPTDGEKGLVLSSRRDFLTQTLAMLDDPTLAAGQDTVARQLVGPFDWRSVVAQINWRELATQTT